MELKEINNIDQYLKNAKYIIVKRYEEDFYRIYDSEIKEYIGKINFIDLNNNYELINIHPLYIARMLQISNSSNNDQYYSAIKKEKQNG